MIEKTEFRLFQKKKGAGNLMKNTNENTRKKAWYKKWWVWVVIVVIVAAIASSGNANSDSSVTKPQSIASSESSASSLPAAAEETVLAVSAKDLLAAYQNNEVSADNQYKDKILSVTGVISDIGVVLDQTYICINGGGDFEILSVQCYISDESEISEKVAALSKGETVTITGTCSGQSLNVELKDCTIGQ